MEYIIRHGEIEDMAEVLRLITELAVYEKEPHAVEISVTDLENDGFGDDPQFEVFIAEANQDVAGIAICYPRYSTWKGRSLHLEDLIVSEKYRGLGIGKGLYQKVISHAFESGMNRIEWEVLDWNKSAIDFYKNSGAEMLENWNLCQMNRSQMKNYLERK